MVEQFRHLNQKEIAKFQRKACCEMCCKSNIRQCPNCKARVEKTYMDTGKFMKCPECMEEFCWSCMTKAEVHDAWYVYCPELNNSMCCNIAVSIVAIIFMPIIMCLTPIVYYGMYFGICYIFTLIYAGCIKNCPAGISAILAGLATILIFPILLLFGILISLIAACLGTIPM